MGGGGARKGGDKEDKGGDGAGKGGGGAKKGGGGVAMEERRWGREGGDREGKEEV